MAISKQRKEELLAQYIELLRESNGAILMDYRGMTVAEMSRVRHELRPLGTRLHVVKNRLMKIALQETGNSLPDEWLVGPTLISFCQDEVPPVAKALMDASKDLESLRIKGGLLDAAPLTFEQVKAIASLPPREVLLAQVLGSINAPASQTAGVIANGVRQVLNVLQAYVDKLQEASNGGELAAEAA